MRHPTFTATLIAVVFTATAAAVVGGCAHTGAIGPGGPGKPKPPPPSTRPLSVQPNVEAAAGQPDMALFWEIWRRVKTDHVSSPISDEKLLLGAIQGMVKFGGDRHSRYVTPEDWREEQMENAGFFCGLGFVLNFGQDGSGPLTVKEVFSGGPADKAGLRPDDVIVAVDGHLTQPLGLEKSIKLIRGRKWTKVTLTVERPGRPKPLSITAVRDDIKIVIVESRLITRDGRRLAYIRLKGFTRAATDDFAQAVVQAKKWRAEAVILDLRNNPGGYVSTAREIGSAWLGRKIIFVVQTRRGISLPLPAEPTFNITDEFRRMPTVVLIDGGSASASEILAGALQDYGLATLVGQKTYGKGSMQTLRQLSNGGILALTENYWKTPGGRVLERNGIEPDVEVKPNGETASQPGQNRVTGAGKTPAPDSQLEKAIETARQKIAAGQNAKNDPGAKKAPKGIESKPK